MESHFRMFGMWYFGEHKWYDDEIRSKAVKKVVRLIAHPQSKKWSSVSGQASPALIEYTNKQLKVEHYQFVK